MQVPGIPPDETKRLMALHGLGLLDSPPTDCLDRLTRLAARALGVPIMLISLVDQERQWFKSCVGLDAAETPREISFCGHAILERQWLMVRDATLDPRFADNPLVTGAPYIRAYLGCPLRTLDGHAIGTLCAIDLQPRDFSDEQTRTVTEFARIIEDVIQAKELEARTTELLEQIRDSERLFRDTVELAAAGILLVAPDGKFIRSNRHSCRMLGYSAAEFHSHCLIDISHPDDVLSIAQAFQQLLAGDVASARLEHRFMSKDGQPIWVHLSITLKRLVSGQPLHVVAVLEDCTTEKQAQLQLIQERDELRSEVSALNGSHIGHMQALRTQVKRAMECERAQRESEHRLHAIANGVPTRVAFWNAELRCEFANEAYARWLGTDARQLIGKSKRQVIGDELFRKCEPYARLALAGREQRFERAVTRADGTVEVNETRYLPDRELTGTLRGFYVFESDITALRDARSNRAPEASSTKPACSPDSATTTVERRASA